MGERQKLMTTINIILNL